ncbi:MAG: LacI family DNA-binding transcriptional regulator [Nocardioides sp.]
MAATIRDVAKQAGVSIATVSRAMRDSADVRADTRERVRAVAAELRYVPSQLGRQLAERRHAANGIVFPDLSGPYYAEVVLGYEAVAAELGRSVLILSTHGREDPGQAVRDMANRCDGLVILGRTVSDDEVVDLAESGAKIVLVARPQIAPLDGLSVDSVNTESHDAAVTLTRHLLDTGARRIAFIGDPDTAPDVDDRWRGVKDVVWNSKIHAHVRLIGVDALRESVGARVAAEELAADDELPDAYVCANDELALGLLGELRRAGVDVPGRVQVTGWDDVMAARYAGLTTVRQPMRELGGTAARLLDELITGARTTPRHEVLTTELVIRASTTPRKEAP